MSVHPIVYVRGYAGTQGEVEETVDDPFYGFNKGSTHVRVGPQGEPQFFAFESPLVRLMTDYGYKDVFEGDTQVVHGDGRGDPKKSLWIYRYYDPTSRTFAAAGGRRLTIEKAAKGLAELIDSVKGQTGADKVILIAHSMGGLVCRSLIQQAYPAAGRRAEDNVAKLFTFGTPHGGIHFDVGGGVVEWIRDQIGWNNSDDFGARRMEAYLAPPGAKGDFQPNSLAGTFPEDRVFCLVGTNAHDYEVAHGVSRKMVGPQSDGLVQIQHAYVKGSHRAYVHRSHSGRYGMVNSEEGYQNLQRFLFGNVKVKISLHGVGLPAPPKGLGKDEAVFYQADVRAAIRGLPILMHEQTVEHHCPVVLDARAIEKPVHLFTAFLLPRASPATQPGLRPGTAKAARKRSSPQATFRQGNTIPKSATAADQRRRYALGLAVHRFRHRRNRLVFSDHIEQVPLWADHLVVEVQENPSGDGPAYGARYAWLSEREEPTAAMDLFAIDGAGRKITPPPNLAPPGLGADVALPAKARAIFGKDGRIRFDTYDWD